MEISKAGTKERRRTDGVNYGLGLPSPRGRYALRQWMNYLTNLTCYYHYYTFIHPLLPEWKMK